MSYINNNYFKHGSWNAVCDLCSGKFKADELKKRWDGLIVCKEDWEPNHPQKFLRVSSDPKSVPFVRSDPYTVFVNAQAIAGVAIAGIAVAGVNYYLNGPQYL